MVSLSILVKCGVCYRLDLQLMTIVDFLTDRLTTLNAAPVVRMAHAVFVK